MADYFYNLRTDNESSSEEYFLKKGGPLSQHLPEIRNSVHDHQTRLNVELKDAVFFRLQS